MHKLSAEHLLSENNNRVSQFFHYFYWDFFLFVSSVIFFALSMSKKYLMLQQTTLAGVVCHARQLQIFPSSVNWSWENLQVFISGINARSSDSTAGTGRGCMFIQLTCAFGSCQSTVLHMSFSHVNFMARLDNTQFMMNSHISCYLVSQS